VLCPCDDDDDANSAASAAKNPLLSTAISMMFVEQFSLNYTSSIHTGSNKSNSIGYSVFSGLNITQ